MVRQTTAILAATLGLALLLELALRLLGAGKPEPGEVPMAESLTCVAWLRVAVIGESSAAGFGSPLSFEEVVRVGLQRAFPERCVALANFAEEGARFHADQARLAHAILPSFDVLLVYAGNNEVLNGIFAQGGTHVLELGPIRDQRADVAAKVKRVRDEVEGRATMVARIARRSRLLALARATLGRWTQPVVARLASGYGERTPRPCAAASPPATAVRKVARQRVIDRLGERYTRDLQRLARRARRLGKVVVASTVVTFDPWPPFFSRRAYRLSDAQAATLDFSVKRAEVERLAGRADTARAAVEVALALDPRHARASHLRGLLALDAGDFPGAWRFLERARDDDGFPIRTLSTVNAHVRALGAAGELPVADAERAVRDLVERGARFEDFLIDPQHPGPLGHLLIGRALLCALHDVPGFAREVLREACTPLDASAIAAWRMGGGGWSHVSRAAAFALVGTRIAWLTRMRRLSAFPQPFFAAAARAWREHRARRGERGDDAASALLAALGRDARGDRLDALRAVTAAHPTEVARAARDGLTIEDPGADARALVLAPQDLAQSIALDGARLAVESRDGTHDGAPAETVRLVEVE